MSIAILCPTRGRPREFLRMTNSVLKTKSKHSEIPIYAASNGDDGYVSYHFPIDSPTVYMWNMLAKEAMKNPDNRLFMLCADDVIFSTPLWDEAIINHYNALENKVHVYAFQDSRDVNGTPHPVVTREWIEEMGYAFPPFFLHWYVDTWTVAIAKANGVFTHMKDYLLVHDKPSDAGKRDETHLRIRVNGWRERDAYINETCQHLLQHEMNRLDNRIAVMERFEP